MIYEKISLDSNDENAYLEVFAPDKIAGCVRDGLLVIPGGGYGCVCHDREGEPVAMAFLPYGFASFVLHYSVSGNVKFPTQLIQASRAMAYIRDNNEKYGVNSNRIFAAGFSAGGHLAGSLGILWNNEEVNRTLDIKPGYNRPDGIMMIYPVVSGEKSIAHEGSIINLLKTEYATDAQRDMVSLEKHVNKGSSPAFIMHTASDELVDVRNSLNLANSYNEAGVMYELHVYPNGPHGVALANDITACDNSGWSDESMSHWVKQAVLWSKKI